MSIDTFRALLTETRVRAYTRTERVPLDELDGWYTDPDSGALRHHSGRFFSIEGVRVHLPGHAVPEWDQPLIVQPEVGILGLLVKHFDGVPHFLVQLKPEPGNRNGVQISPTVQATRSNYTGVHRGSAVPYLRYFREAGRHRVLADVRQSEHGSWFLGKRNRNMVVATDDDIEVLAGFGWLTRAELDVLLGEDDLVNMDTRSVLACLPAEPVPGGRHQERAAHTLPDLLRWITDIRALTELTVRLRPLHDLAQWRRHDGMISHRTGRFFDVIGVRVEAAGREVGQWSQPMIAPRGQGLVALLVTRIEGTLHALVHLRTEPGCADIAELAPTVQCTPRNYDHLPAAARPVFLDEILGADPRSVLFDTMLSDEGGRFHHSSNRHLIVETTPRPEPPGFRWMTVGQLGELLRHSFYVNMQTRSLLTCLHTVETTSRRRAPRTTPTAAATVAVPAGVRT